MFLNQELLQACENLFEQISNIENSQRLDYSMNSLRHFLEKDVDGFTSHAEDKLAYAVQSRTQDIWNLISKKEKKENSDLADLYVEVLNLTEDASEYEADEIENDDDYDEENNVENKEEDL